MSMCLCVGREEMERERNRPLHLISRKAPVGAEPRPTSGGEMQTSANTLQTVVTLGACIQRENF